MFHHLNKTLFIKAVLYPVLCMYAVFCCSCGFVDLRPVKFTTIPEGPWALLPGEESPVIVSFDTAMEKTSVEKAFQVYSPTGIADGGVRWEGNTLIFNPAVPWKPGLRYGLRLSGTLNALDGRELILSKDFPFYAISHSILPYVVSFSPADGESVGVTGQNILEIVFSRPMDSRNTEDALKLDIPGEKIFTWLDDNKVLHIKSDKPLNPWAAYRWSLSDSALSREGAPLAKEVQCRFITDLDREFINVIKVLPLMPPLAGIEPDFPVWGGWLPVSVNLEQGLGSGHGIGVEFNIPAEADSLRRAFSFMPSLPGRVEILSPVSAVFIPSKDPEPETVYSLRISGNLKDTCGLKMGEDYTTIFSTDIPFLFVNSVSIIGGEEKIFPESNSVITVPVGVNRRIGLFINFSLMFDADNKALLEENVFKISLRPFFPADVAPVSLRTARWFGSDSLFMEWEGAVGGEPGSPGYYRLIIPGTAGGIQTGKGSYLKENLTLYLEAIHE